MSITLPKPNEVIKPTLTEPKLLLIYSLPKVFKTTACLQLPDSLLIDLEDRDEVIGTRINIVGLTKDKYRNNKAKDITSLDYLKTLYEIGEEIKKQDKPYKRIIIDSVSFLEDWCESDATSNYKKSKVGAKFDGESVLELDYGAGYNWLRNSFKRWIGYVITLAPQIILTAHVKSSALETIRNNEHVETGGKLVESADLDLTGKIKRIACAASDAIGFGYRKSIGKGLTETILSFQNSGEILCGSPYIHLNNKKFEFGKYNTENGEVVYNWELIYPSLKLNS